MVIKKIMVELQGLEPWTPALQRQCSSQLSYSPIYKTGVILEKNR